MYYTKHGEEKIGNWFELIFYRKILIYSLQVLLKDCLVADMFH